jgi:catechol 2,3-dioxygenase-like lactoylglutathione lyase family enzyme
MKTFWLSFVGDDGFRGVAVVEVSEEEAEQEFIDAFFDYPAAGPEAGWIAAASRKAHSLGCNPGGEVGCMEVPDEAMGRFAKTPRGVLLQKETLRQLGHIS